MMDEQHIGQALDHRLQSVFCVCCVFECLLLPSFSGIWHGVNGCGEIPTACNVVCLSHGNILFYWSFLPMDYYEDDFFLKLYCLIDNNNVSFYRVLMNENGYKEMSHS